MCQTLFQALKGCTKMNKHVLYTENMYTQAGNSETSTIIRQFDGLRNRNITKCIRNLEDVVTKYNQNSQKCFAGVKDI